MELQKVMIPKNSIDRPLGFLLEAKYSSDFKYIKLEEKIYNMETGTLMSEGLIIEGTWGEWLSDMLHFGADIASMAADFLVAGSGAVIDVLNGVSYFIEAQFQEGERKDYLQMAGVITLGMTFLPALAQNFGIVLKNFLRTNKVTKGVLEALKYLSGKISTILSMLPKAINKAINTPLGQKLLGKHGKAKIANAIKSAATSIRTTFNKIARGTEYMLKGSVAAKSAAKTGTKRAAAKAAVVGGAKLTASAVRGAKKFFTRIPKIKNAKQVLTKAGFAKGRTYRYISDTGQASTVTITKMTDDIIEYTQGIGKRIVTRGKAPFKVSPEKFIKNAIGAPWGKRGWSVGVPFYMKRWALGWITPEGELNYTQILADDALDPDQVSRESLAGSEEVAGYEGDTGSYTVKDVVKFFQTGLEALGWKLAKHGVDGKFGRETQAGILKFQKIAGIPEDGKMTKTSLKKLTAYLRSKKQLQNVLNSNPQFAGLLQSHGIQSENKQNNNNTIMEIKVKDLKEFIQGKKPLVIETTTVGALRTQIKENSKTTRLGQGFKTETVSALDNNEVGQSVKSKIEEEEDVYTKDVKKKTAEPKGRAVHQKGSMMLGDGFKLTEAALAKLNLTEGEWVNIIETIVESLKGNSDYTNLKFVDTIGKKYHMNESHIMEMKNIIYAENSVKTANNLYGYIVECACEHAQNNFQGYTGLAQGAQEMVPQIKGAFNKNRGAMELMQALAATAKGANVPMEMVEEMYEAQKSAHKMKLESGMNGVGVNEQLEEIYERYQGMSEGDVYGMYDEMAEMMDYPASDSVDMAELDEEIDLFDGNYDLEGGDEFGELNEYGMDDEFGLDTELDLSMDDEFGMDEFADDEMPMNDFGEDEMMAEAPLDFEDDLHTSHPETDGTDTQLGILQKLSAKQALDPHGNDWYDQEEPEYNPHNDFDFSGEDDEEEFEFDFAQPEVADVDKLGDMDNPLEEEDSFEQVMREMEGFVSEHQPTDDMPTDDMPNNEPIDKTVPSEDGTTEYTIAPTEGGYNISDSMGSEMVHVYVENGRIISQNDIDGNVRAAILDMEGVNDFDMESDADREAEFYNPDGEFEQDMPWMGEAVEISEVKSALDNLDIGVQTKSQFDEAVEDVSEVKSALDNMVIGQTAMADADEEKR